MGAYLASIDPSAAWRVWNNINETYSACLLTKPADKLIALAGMVKAYAPTVVMKMQLACSGTPFYRYCSSKRRKNRFGLHDVCLCIAPPHGVGFQSMNRSVYPRNNFEAEANRP